MCSEILYIPIKDVDDLITTFSDAEMSRHVGIGKMSMFLRTNKQVMKERCRYGKNQIRY